MSTVARLKGHRGRVSCAALLDGVRRDGKQVLYAITGATDCQAIVWAFVGPLTAGLVQVEKVQQLCLDRPVIHCALFVDRHGRTLALTSCRDQERSFTIWDAIKGVKLCEVTLTEGKLLSARLFEADDTLVVLIRTDIDGDQVYSVDIVDKEANDLERLEGFPLNSIPLDSAVAIVKLCKHPKLAEEKVPRVGLEWEDTSEEVVVFHENRPNVRVLTGQPRITDVEYNERTALLCSSDVDGLLKVFDLRNVQEEYTWMPSLQFDAHSGCINKLCIHKSGTLVFTVSDDSTSFLVDLRPEEREVLLALASSVHPRLGIKCPSELKWILSDPSNSRIRELIREFLV